MSAQLEALQDLAEHIQEGIGSNIQGYSIDHGELTLTANPDTICKTLQFLRDDRECKFQMLIDICGADYPEREKRFEVIYNLLSMSNNNRIRLKISVAEEEQVPTATNVYSSAGWFEREVWDLYGIYFADHPDLRRILTDYGFEGHPLRKDFPLTGYVEVRYCEEQRRVVYEPVQLTQDFRTFDYLSPWEGMTDIQLPGDEKGTQPDIGWKPYKKAVGEE